MTAHSYSDMPARHRVAVDGLAIEIEFHPDGPASGHWWLLFEPDSDEIAVLMCLHAADLAALAAIVRAGIADWHTYQTANHPGKGRPRQKYRPRTWWHEGSDWP